MSTSLTPRDAIKKEYGATSKNPMTPRVLGYGRITDTLVYELATGYGIPDNPRDGFVGPQIWGLSVVEIGSDCGGSGGNTITRRRHDLSVCLHSREAIREHIKKIKRDNRVGCLRPLHYGVCRLERGHDGKCRKSLIPLEMKGPVP